MNRQREVWLLLLAFLLLGVGYWVVWQAYLPVWHTLYPEPWRFYAPPAVMLGCWLLVSLTLALRRCRETLLLPIVALIIGLGLLFLLRLAGGAGALGLEKADNLLRNYHKQFFSLLLGWTVLMGLLLGWKDYHQLSRYKYLIAALAVGLLLITTIFGGTTGGQTIALTLGSFSFQPHDPVKLLLVVFMAAYLVEKKELLSFAAGRFGLLTLMDLRYMGPLVTLWLLVMMIIFKHNDLGAALLLFGALLVMLYLGTERRSYLFVGLALFLIGGVAAYTLSGRVQHRVAVWQNPWTDPNDAGYQICQSLMALGNGRVIGAGLAGGAPERIPAVHTDMIYAAISEDLGLVGAVAVIGLFLALIGRMVHIALSTRDRFGQLMVAGLAATLAIQTWVILAGVIKFIPLTGITLPFVSYGGTSLVVNLVLIGIVLKVAEEPPADSAA